MLHATRKTKIIATIGPSSSDSSIIRGLYDAGVNMFRLNFSHGNHETHRRNAHIIRNIEQDVDRPIAIMMDLQGPKIRIGVFEDGQITLKNGSKFILDMETEFGNLKRVTLPHPEIFSSLKEGAELLLDDGKLKLQVINNNGTRIETKVITGGVLSNKKGLNIPNILLPISALTEKDKNDLKIVEEIGADYIAVSFVQQADDINYARKFITSDVKIIAKIEKPKAIENLDSIIEAADAVMVARGDLGVEMPLEMVPGTQKLIVTRCRYYKKPVIVATQMLESMIQSPVPTRAEVSDIACAVDQNADAVMLSAESASGKHPIEAVKIMDRVIRRVEFEADEKDRNHERQCTSHLDDSIDSAITHALCSASSVSHIKLIAVFTESGRTAVNVSNGRPRATIISLTPNIKTARRMCLVWGVHSLVIEDLYSFSQMDQIVQAKIANFCNVEKTEHVAVVAGIPFRQSGFTNILHICEISKKEEE